MNNEKEASELVLVAKDLQAADSTYKKQHEVASKQLHSALSHYLKVLMNIDADKKSLAEARSAVKRMEKATYDIADRVKHY